MQQQISKMKKELNAKQYEEKNNFKNNFFRKYPSENNYANEISNFTQKIKQYKKENNINKAIKYEGMKEKFLKEKHDEYIEKMGMDYEKALEDLKEKFKKENLEQKRKIRKFILNRKIRELEKEKDKNMNNTSYNSEFTNNRVFNLSQDNIFRFYNNIQNNNNYELKENNKNGLCSKIFKFGGGENPYKTIII